MKRRIVGIAALAAGVVVCGGTARGQYIQKWANNHNLANLDDIGEDVVIGVEGHVFSVGWVTVSGTKTQYRLRVLDGDVANDPTGGSVIATKVWPTAPNTEDFHKAHAVAIGQTAQPQEEGGVAVIPIFVTGESPNQTGQGLNIVTLRYLLSYTPGIAGGTVTGPAVCTYNNNLLAGGDDIGWDIEVVGFSNTSGYVVVTGQSEGNGTGLDAITLGIIAEPFPGGPTWTSRYTQGGASGRDDVTVAVARGPDLPQFGTVVVAGYSRGATSDDFLVRALDAATGATINDWRHDTGYNERANAIVAGDPSLGVFAAGWTEYTVDSFGEGEDLDVPTWRNYLTTRFDVNSSGLVWRSVHDGAASKDDVAYSIAHAPEREKDDPPQPAALFVGGASQGRISPGGAESGYDYKVINYEPDTGLIPTAWQGFDDGGFNRILGGNSPDEAYAITLDWLGEVYTTGRTKLTSFDFGTVRFFRSSGLLDPGDNIGNNKFPPFFSAGTAGQDDQANAVAAHYGYIVDELNPDIAVVGTVVTTGQLKNIRTIKYEDHD